MSGWRAALVALIVGAVILGIGYLIPRLGADAAPPDDGDAEDTSGVVLVCAPVLHQACQAVADELDLDTARLEPGRSLPDRHVLVAPASELPEGSEPGPPLVRSPIVIGAWLERSQILSARCGTIDLDCLAGAVGERWEDLGGNDTWGDFKLGLASPATSESGVLALAMLTPAVERSDLAASLRLVARDDARLTEDLVLFGDSRADVVVTTEVSVFNQMENAIGRGGRLEVFYPASSPWVEYVTVAKGFGAGRLVDRLSDPAILRLFAGSGVRPVTGTWDLPPGLGTAGATAAPPDSGTRATLLEVWEQLR
jgi:hypothetical protein